MAPPSLRSLGNARLGMLNKPRALTTRAEFAADIRREWANALEATVAVGRRLNEAKATLPHGAYEAMVESDLPFGTATARKLREIAAFVDTDKVPLDRLPEAMSTLYVIATLPEETRVQALDQGVIRPEVTRAEVEALKPPKHVAPECPEVMKVGLADLFAGSADLPVPAAAPVMEEVFGFLCAVEVPDLLLMRLSGVLDSQQLRGPSMITLRYTGSSDFLTLHRRGDAYEMAVLYAGGCTYSSSVMPKAHVADFLRSWLANSPVETTGGKVVMVEELPAGVALSLPPITVKEPSISPLAYAMDVPWAFDPQDRCSIVARPNGGTAWEVLAALHNDDTAAAIAQYVIDLHNAKLMGG